MASGKYFFFLRIRPRKCHIFTNRSIEQESFLQHDAELCSIGIQFHSRQIYAVDQDAPARRHVKRRDQPNDRRFASPGWTHECRDGSWLRTETHVVQNFLPRVVGKAHVFHLYQPVHALERPGPSRLIVFQLLVQNFACALQTGDGLGDLGANGYDLKDGRNEQA